MMISLPSVLGNMTLAEIEQRFAGGKTNAPQASHAASRRKLEINTKLAEVTIPITGCEGANFFEHVVSGVTLVSE